MEFTKDTGTFSSFPSYRVQFADGGEGRIAVTDGNHIHFDANHHCINGREGDRCWIVCRGIEYGASVHFHNPGGEWKVMDRPHVSRVATSKDASPAAILWITKTMLEIVREFTRTHALVLAQAGTAQILRDIEKQQTELAQARARVAELEKQGAGLAREYQLAITLESRAK